MSLILVTGFEPFGGEKVNPSAVVAQSLKGREVAPGVVVRAATIPVTWVGAVPALLEAASRLGATGAADAPGAADTPGGPDAPGATRASAGEEPLLAVVALGQASGYPGLGLERVAVNIASGVDNAGVERTDEPIVPGGPASYFSTLPLAAMLAAIEAAGIPAFISNSAGTYLCNRVFYGLQHHFHGKPPRQPVPLGGFIHVPLLPEQAVGKKPIPPSMSLQDMERGLLAALAVVAAAALSPH